MTPDIREKAERLKHAIHEAEYDLYSAGRGNEADAVVFDLISQALLEAHNAGREEAAKLIEEGYERKVAKAYRDDGVRSKNDQCEHGRYMYEDCEACAAHAIRSLP